MQAILDGSTSSAGDAMSLPYRKVHRRLVKSVFSETIAEHTIHEEIAQKTEELHETQNKAPRGILNVWKMYGWGK